VNQHVIDALVFAWATLHDFLYLGVYHVAMRFHWLKRHDTLDDRIERIEHFLGSEALAMFTEDAAHARRPTPARIIFPSHEETR
jgi:hypothetical protein